MAKLIKLSTTTDQNRTGNSFNCLSDQDIIIEANSKISLLNCQITSGILKDYFINGQDILPGAVPEQVGELWGYLDLVAPTPATNDPLRRRLILRNGSYNITTLCAEIKKSILDALVSCSCGGYTSTTGTTLPMPADSPDFEMSVDVYVNKDNKIEIDYNSKPILTTANITFSNLKTGCTFDPATGNVSYFGAGSLPNEVPIDPAKSTGTFQDCTVITQGSTVGVFTPGNVVTLMAYNNPEVSPPAYNIKSITAYATNLDSAIPLEITLADQANLTVYSTSQSTDRGFKSGDVVGIDDGTSVDGAPSANLTFGTLDTVDVEFINPNYEVSIYPKVELESFDEAYDVPAQPLIEPSPNNYQFEVECDPTTDIINKYCLITVGTQTSPGFDRTVAVGVINTQITSTTNPDNSTVVIAIFPLEGVPLSMLNNFQKYGGEIRIVSNFFSTNIANAAEYESYFPQDAKFWLCDKVSDTPVSRVLVHSFAENTGGDALYIELDLTEPFEIWNNKTILVGLQGLAYIVGLYGTDWSRFYLTPAYLLMSSDALAPGTVNIAANNPVVITENGVDFLAGQGIGGGNIPVILAAAPEPLNISSTIHTLFDYEVNIADANLEYLNNQVIVGGLTTGAALQIFKTSNDTHIKFKFATITTAAKIPLATRIWEGSGITASYSVNLTRLGRPTNNWDITKFSDMVKGDYSPKYGDKYSFALCDEICNQGAGRAVFLVQQLPAAASGADIGLIKIEGNSFANMESASADYRVSIGKKKGGGLKYNLFADNKSIVLRNGSTIEALAGDKVVIQWNCAYGFTFDNTVGIQRSRGDKQFIANTDDLTVAIRNPGTYIAPVPGQPDAQTRELMRNNITFSVIRAQSLDWQYIGSTVGNDTSGAWAGSVYPYTPFDNPVLEPIKWDTTTRFAPFIRPGATGIIRMMELTGDPMTTTSLDGVKQPFDGANYISHPDLHTPDIEIASNNSTKYTDPANAVQLLIANPRIQKLLGFSELAYSVNGASGSIVANKSTLEAYLPENILVMLDTAPAIDTFDCGQYQGKRRQIVCCAINTQSPTGDINIEPANLYRISLGNKTAINSRKFTVSFETFYGEQIILANAKATVNLLIEA